MIINIKNICDNSLEKYRLENRIKRKYEPHITLCTNDNIENAFILANNKFKKLNIKIQYLWIYDYNMALVKEYKLEN